MMTVLSVVIGIHLVVILTASPSCQCACRDIYTTTTCDGRNSNISSLPFLENRETIVNLFVVHSNIPALRNGSILLPTFPNLRSLGLYSNGIFQLNEQFFANVANVSQLHLQRNELSMVPSNSLSVLTKLTYLDLSGNRILELPAKCFVNNRYLKIVMLYRNNISSVHKEAFMELRHLEVLNLAWNNITEINLCDEKTHHLTSLTLLNLKRNSMEYFHCSNNLSMLTSYDAEDNELSYLDEYSLHGLSQLKTLWLPGNHLSDVHEFTFGNTTHGLQHLTLSRNRFSDIPTQFIKMLTFLEILNLQFNSITALPARAFQANEFLYHINLEHNLIHVTAPNSLTGITRLRYLNLRGNVLNGLPSSGFLEEEEDFGIVLTGNPWTCDCNALPLYNWLSKSRFYEHDLICQSPISVFGEQLMKLSVTDFCDVADMLTTQWQFYESTTTPSPTVNYDIAVISAAFLISGGLFLLVFLLTNIRMLQSFINCPRKQDNRLAAPEPDTPLGQMRAQIL
ncbi:uncharacterized protein [Apostichopus japonicus]|uniref:uncharacterized protein isoform X1 n=2 Tax=Stichopus japonicus TaxID=307972 RepID=UPI003AB84A93